MPTVDDLGDVDKTEETKKPAEEKSPSLPVATKVDDHVEEDEGDDDEDIDETLTERLWGLTEMFPESLRNFTAGTTSASVGATKWLYHVGRIGLWVAASSATILALPVMFESERSQMEEQQLAQQRQMLLGPNAAVSGGAVPGLVPPVR